MCSQREIDDLMPLDISRKIINSMNYLTRFVSIECMSRASDHFRLRYSTFKDQILRSFFCRSRFCEVAITEYDHTTTYVILIVRTCSTFASTNSNSCSTMSLQLFADYSNSCTGSFVPRNLIDFKTLYVGACF